MRKQVLRILGAAGCGIGLGGVILAGIYIQMRDSQGNQTGSRKEVSEKTETGEGEEQQAVQKERGKEQPEKEDRIPGEEEIQELYRTVLEEYERGAAESFQGDYTYAADYFSEGTFYRGTSIFYTLYDLCGDGIPELLIADSCGKPDTYLLEDIWGTDGKEVYRMTGEAERNGSGNYYICKGNVLASAWTSGLVSVCEYYQLSEGNPTAEWITGIAGDAGKNAQNPEPSYYQLQEQGAERKEEYRISEGEFRKIQKQYEQEDTIEQNFEWKILWKEEKEMVALYYGLEAPAEDFLFPYSSQQELTQEQLDTMVREDIEQMRSVSQMAINEILARYGFTFKGNSRTGKEAADHFSGKGWYQQAQTYCTATDANVVIADMNEIEKKNIELINAWQLEHIPY